MITITELKSFLDITLADYDDALNLIIGGVESFVKNYCHNILNLQTGINEVFDDTDIASNSIFLANRVNIANVVLSYNSGSAGSPVWTLETTDNYLTYEKEGRIELISARAGKRIYQAVYDAGFSANNVPDDLKLAVLKLASANFNKRKSEGQASENAEGYGVNFNNSLSDEIKRLLVHYKSL